MDTAGKRSKWKNISDPRDTIDSDLLNHLLLFNPKLLLGYVNF